MDKQEVLEQVRSIIEGFLERENIELVDIIYRYEGRDLVLRLLVDKPEGGISIEECAGLNNSISSLLDEEGIIQQKYILEVSSPGLDRPLKTKNDFLRCIGRKAKFFLNEKVNGKIEWDGVIDKVSADSVFINTQQGSLEIPLSKINKAKQIVES